MRLFARSFSPLLALEGSLSWFVEQDVVLCAKLVGRQFPGRRRMGERATWLDSESNPPSQGHHKAGTKSPRCASRLVAQRVSPFHSSPAQRSLARGRLLKTLTARIELAEGSAGWLLWANTEKCFTRDPRVACSLVVSAEFRRRERKRNGSWTLSSCRDRTGAGRGARQLLFAARFMMPTEQITAPPSGQGKLRPDYPAWELLRIFLVKILRCCLICPTRVHVRR